MEAWVEILKWPGVAIILAVLFRKPLIAFLNRATRIGIGEGRIEAHPADQRADVEVTPSPADELLKTFNNALVLHYEDLIRDELDRRGIDQPADRERVLTRYLAAVGIAQSFDRIYNLIWGSQISALQFLNQMGEIGANAQVLKLFYDQGKAGAPNLYGNYTFDQWVGFLEAASLVQKSGEKVMITLSGSEFLKYLIDQKYITYKGG